MGANFSRSAGTDAPEEILVGFYFSGYAVAERKLHLLNFKSAVFIFIAVHEPSAKTAKICTTLKLPATRYDTHVIISASSHDIMMMSQVCG